MNKKLIGIIGGIIVVLLIGMTVLKDKGIEPVKGIKAVMKPSIDVESPSSFLPENTAMYYSMSDLKGIWSDIQGSNFWKQFSSHRLWTDIGFKENLNQMLSTLESQIGMEITESRLMDVLGRQVVIGVVFDSETAKPRVIVQSFVGKATQFVEGLLKSMPETTDSVKQTEHKGEIISTMLPQEGSTTPFSVSYVLVNNIFTAVFGEDDEELKGIIDIIKGDSKDTLLSSSDYKKFEETYLNQGSGSIIYYADIEKISGDMEKIIQPVVEAAPEQFAGVSIEEVTKKFKTVAQAGGAIFRTNSGLMLKSHVIPNPEFLSDEEKLLAEQNKSQKLGSLKLTPVSALISNITTNIGNNLNKTWGGFLESTPSAQSSGNKINDILQTIKTIEEGFGFSIQKDIIDQLQSEMLFVFDGINLEGMFPIPRLALVFEVKDGAKSLNKITGIISEALKGETTPIPLSFNDKTILGDSFKVLTTPLGEGLSPVIGHSENWLIIATNSLTGENILKSKKGQADSIVNSSTFKDYVSTDKEYSNCNLTDIRALNKQLRTLLNWLLQRKEMMPVPNLESIATNVSTYALPIMEQLEVFKAVAFKSYKEGNISIQEGNIIIEDLK